VWADNKMILVWGCLCGKKGAGPGGDPWKYRNETIHWYIQGSAGLDGRNKWKRIDHSDLNARGNGKKGKAKRSVGSSSNLFKKGEKEDRDKNRRQGGFAQDQRRRQNQLLRGLKKDRTNWGGDEGDPYQVNEKRQSS